MRDLVVKIFASIGLYKPIVEIINKAKFEIQARRMRKNGLAMLAAADAVFTKLGVRAFLTYGALLGYKKQPFMACENLSEDFIEQWSVWLNTPISPHQSYLEASLSNSRGI